MTMVIFGDRGGGDDDDDCLEYTTFTHHGILPKWLTVTFEYQFSDSG